MRVRLLFYGVETRLCFHNAMEVIFMGTGTSQGVPMIACDHPGLDLANPKNWRTRTSVHVVMDGVHFQVDAAQEFRMQCLANKITWVDYVLLTHGHADHVLGMDDLRRFCDLRGNIALPVYGDEPTLERIRSIYPYACRKEPRFRGYPAFDLTVMPAKLELPQGTIECTPLPHGFVDTLGYVFTEKSTGAKFSYFTDCSEVTPEARALAKGSDLVVLDALRKEPHPTHMTVAQATAAAQATGAPLTYFTHLTGYLDYATEEPLLPSGIHYAWDGLRVTLN